MSTVVFSACSRPRASSTDSLSWRTSDVYIFAIIATWATVSATVQSAVTIASGSGTPVTNSANRAPVTR